MGGRVRGGREASTNGRLNVSPLMIRLSSSHHPPRCCYQLAIHPLLLMREETREGREDGRKEGGKTKG